MGLLMFFALAAGVVGMVMIVGGVLEQHSNGKKNIILPTGWALFIIALILANYTRGG